MYSREASTKKQMFSLNKCKRKHNRFTHPNFATIRRGFGFGICLLAKRCGPDVSDASEVSRESFAGSKIGGWDSVPPASPSHFDCSSAKKSNPKGNLAVATLPARMASGTVIVIPSNGANMIQTAPGLPSVALQASGATLYPLYGAQQLQIPTSAPQQVPQNGPLERFLKAEPKVLGAIQIMIGLIHIGFGAISFCLLSRYYLPLAAIGGYPFWGGIFFISSGSVSVAAANRPNRGLVKSSVGMNITSAIMALTGIMLFICDLTISASLNNPTVIISVGYGLSSVLLMFSLLEFCIAVSLAHFGCRATCCSDAQPTVLFVPYQVIGGGEVAAQPNHPPPPPPTYDNVITKSQ